MDNLFGFLLVAALACGAFVWMGLIVEWWLRK